MIYLCSELSNVYTGLYSVVCFTKGDSKNSMLHFAESWTPTPTCWFKSCTPSLPDVSPCTVAKLSSLALPDSEQALSQGWQTAGRKTCSHLEQHRLRGTATTCSRHCCCPVSLEVTGFFLGVTTARQARLTQKTINVCKICPFRRWLTAELWINQDAGDHLVRCQMSSLHCSQS